MIEATSLSKHFRKKLAVDNLSFSVETGKVTGFLGPNGAGKSTTMRLMLGLNNGPGRTLYDGKNLFDYSRPSSIVGVLLEAKAFHPTRTARNHLKVLADQGGIPAARVAEVLDIVGLTSEAKGKPGKFSLGMSQRLGIAAALLGKPKYLILDEPANGLDPEGIAWLRQFLRNYASEGNGVFVSSHLLSEMAQMADNVLVIGKGKMIANTSVKELLAGSAHRGTFVRTDKPDELKQALKKAKLVFNDTEGGLLVDKAKSDQVGKLAFKAGIPLLELTNRGASLEEAFLDLTAGSEEYHAKEKSDA